MARKAALTALVVLGAIAVLAALASAQTPPPASGDWVVTDYTEYKDTSITVNGSINVTGVLGRLSLTNVTLVINRALGSDAVIQDAPNSGGMMLDGCTVSATGDRYLVKLSHNSWLKDCELYDLTYLYVAEDLVTVTGCTLWRPRDNGIYVFPSSSSWKLGRIEVSGNTIIESGNIAIMVTIFQDPSMAVDLRLYENTIKSPAVTGINSYIHGSGGTLRLNGTHVETPGSKGMELGLDGIALDIDDAVLIGSGGVGIEIFNWGTLPGGMVFRNVTVEGFDDGVAIDGNSVNRPSFMDWTFVGVKGDCFWFRNVMCATVEGVYILDVFSSRSFYLEGSTVDVYSTRGTLGLVTADSSSSLYSFRRLQLSATWQNGLPCAGRTVEVRDEKNRLAVPGVVLDPLGGMPQRYVWDLRALYSGTDVRTSLLPILTDGPTSIAARDGAITFDGDIDEAVVFVDDIAPALSVTSPPGGLGQNTTALIVQGTCGDPHSGVEVVQLSLDAQGDWALKAWTNATGIASWQHTFADLAEGTYTVYVRAFDRASWPGGAFARAEVGGIRIDTTVPRIAITAPADGFRTRETSVIVRGTVDADTVELTVGGAGASHTLGAFVESVPVVEGVNAIVVTARDGVGNSNSITVHVEMDTVPPALGIVSPLEGYRTNLTRLLVAGTTEAGASVTVQGQAATVTTTSWEATVSLSAGTNVLAVEALDDVGNRARSSVTIVLDRLAPSISVTAPGEGAVFNTTVVLVYLLVTEEDILAHVTINGVEYVTVPIATVGLALNAEPVGPLPEGPSEIRVVATDLAGNVEVLLVRVTIDTTPPSLMGLTPPDGASTNNPHLPLSGSTEAAASLSVQGKRVELVRGAFTVALELREGWNDVVLVVTDGAGNRNLSSIRVLLDTIAPELVLDNLGPDLMVTIDGRTFNLTGRTEPLARVVLEVAGSSLELAVGPDGSFSHVVDMGSGSTVTVNLTATDAVGNPTMLAVSIDRRVVAPAWTDSPAVVGGTAAAAVLIVFVVAGTVETTKYSLLVLFVALYARIAKGEVLDNRTRYALHGLIIENPGLHYNAIIREFGLTNGEAAYHLSVLEREGFIRSVRDGTLRKFYSTTTKVPREHRATPEEMRDRIMDIVDGLPGISQKQIVDELGIGRTLAGYHLGCLVTEGFIEARRDGRFTVYYPTRKRREGHARPMAPLDGARADGGPGMQQ